LTAAEKWRRDAERIAWIHAQGYSVKTFWEEDIRRSGEHVQSVVTSLVKQRMERNNHASDL
jgi:very-short-patch-repair endonuclease